MKKIFIAAAMFLPAAAFAQNGAYVVKGKIGSFNAPAKAYLEHRENDKLVIDSTVVKDGAFEFKGTASSPTNAYLLLSPKGDGIKGTHDYKSLYLEPGTIIISGTDAMASATVTGTKTNAENAKYDAMLKPVNDAYDALEARKKAASTDEQASEAFQKQYNADEKAIEKQEAEANKKFIQENPDSYISLNALETYAYSADYKDLAPLYDHLSAGIKASEAGKKFAERLTVLKTVAIGATAPVFAQADTTGKMVSLDSFRGKYVLVDFWASWCGPCRRENPNVVRAYGHYKGKNFTIIGVSLDRQNGREKWLAAIHKDGLTWTQVSDLQFWNNKAAQLYGIQAIPQNFLLDPEGRIIGKNLTGNDLENKLEEIFGKI